MSKCFVAIHIPGECQYNLYGLTEMLKNIDRSLLYCFLYVHYDTVDAVHLLVHVAKIKDRFFF